MSRCLISCEVIDDGVQLEVCEVGVGASSESDVDKTGDGETEAGGCSLTYGGLYLIFQHHKVVLTLTLHLLLIHGGTNGKKVVNPNNFELN